ncbi:MAG: FadR family transcriptional regulator [Lentisphaerae bacterium]|nr:FadR family transcriptional regulator [Lentisphaerota bacterium]
MIRDVANGRTLLTDEVIEKLLQLIQERGLKQGDRLPTEAELTELFGVSRIVVRESVKALSFFGLLNTKTRRGTVIGALDMERLGRCLSFQMGISRYPRREILEARTTIEVGHLELVSRNLNDAGIAGLMGAVEGCEAAARAHDPDAFTEHDRALHSQLLEIGGNPILVTFCTLLKQYFRPAASHACKVGDMPAVAREHRGIVEALRDGNLLLAQGLLLKHLQRAAASEASAPEAGRSAAAQTVSTEGAR